MTAAISCTLCTNAIHISGEDWVLYVCDVLYAVLYVVSAVL